MERVLNNMIKLAVLSIVIFCGLRIYSTVFANAKGEAEQIEDGVYVIKSAINENYVFDIYNNSKENGANLELWTDNKGNNQKFNVKKIANGYYSISPVHSNKNIDVEGNSKKEGANVLQWESNNQENQQWIIKDLGNGYCNIISKSNGMCLDIPYSDAKNGANVQVWTSNGGKNQMFKFENQVETIQEPDTDTKPQDNTEIEQEIKGTKTIEDGIYEIKTALNEKYILNIVNGSKENGANLELSIDHLADHQKFDIKYLGDGYYNISLLHSKKSIDVEGNSKKIGTNVLQYKNNNQDNQKWIINDVGNGYFNIISKSNGLYLDIENSKIAVGTNALMWSGNGGKNQLFKFEKQSIIAGETKTVENGIYLIQSALSDNIVLDVFNNSISNGANIEKWQNNSTPNQKFNIEYLEEGYYILSAVHSGKVLDVEGGSKESGTNVIQYEKNNQDNQKWVIKATDDGFFNIISKLSGLYLTISSENVCVEEFNNSANQKFKFENPIPLIGKQTISDGTYIIASAINNGYVFDIPFASSKDGEILEIWSNNLNSNQRFNVTYIGEGYYKINAEHSGKSMEVANKDMKINAKVQQKALSTFDEQKWIIKDVGNGNYNIISKYSELYMEVSDGNASNGTKIQLANCKYNEFQKFKFLNPNSFVKFSTGTYGKSGLKENGDSNGSELTYYKFGSGSNVLFATFCIHGFEDNWYQDGTELVEIANLFWEKLKENNDHDLGNKWTIYIFPEVNPDGRRYGWTNDGPGRTTLYSMAPSNKGIDLNRCWSSDWIYQSSNRYYTGTEPFQAYEARCLREFLLQHKSQNGRTILVDLHGWTQQLIGDSDIRGYYRQYFPENTDTPTYGKGYLINWARNNLGSNNKTAKSALIELPSYIKNSQDVIKYNLKEKYINATLSMLRGID